MAKLNLFTGDADKYFVIVYFTELFVLLFQQQNTVIEQASILLGIQEILVLMRIIPT